MDRTVWLDAFSWAPLNPSTLDTRLFCPSCRNPCLDRRTDFGQIEQADIVSSWREGERGDFTAHVAAAFKSPRRGHLERVESKPSTLMKKMC